MFEDSLLCSIHERFTLGSMSPNQDFKTEMETQASFLHSKSTSRNDFNNVVEQDHEFSANKNPNSSGAHKMVDVEKFDNQGPAVEPITSIPTTPTRWVLDIQIFCISRVRNHAVLALELI